MRKSILPLEVEFEPSKKRHQEILNKNTSSKARKKRIDHRIPLKFPVNEDQNIIIRRLYLIMKTDIGTTSITDFVTMLVRFGLRNPHLLKYDHEYMTNGKEKTVKLNHVERDLLSGPYGLAIEWNVSTRRAIHKVVFNVCKYIRQGGTISNDSVQPIRPDK